MPRVPQAPIGGVKQGGERAPYIRSPASGIMQTSTYLQRAGAIATRSMTQIAARAKARADDSMVNGVMATVNSRIDSIVLEAESVKGTDALADPNPESSRTDKRPVTARVEEQISALINEQRAIPRTKDQLAAIDARIPGLVSKAMLFAHRHEAKQQGIVHDANFAANVSEISNNISKYAKAGDDELVSSELANLDRTTVEYLDAKGLDDTEKRNQIVVETRSGALALAMKNALEEGRVSWVKDQYLGLINKETGKREGGLKTQEDGFGPSFTEDDKTAIDAALRTTSDKQDAYGHVHATIQKQEWAPSEEVGGDHVRELMASIDKRFPPGEQPDKNDTARQRARADINTHNAAVRASQKRHRARFFEMIKNGVAPKDLPLNGREYITEDAWKAFNAWYDASMLKAAGESAGPKVSDRAVLRAWSDLSPTERIDAVDSGEFEQVSGLLKTQDYEDRLEEVADIRKGVTPPNELESAIRKKILTSQPDLDVSPTGGDKAIVDDWTMKIAARIARMEADEGRGKFPRERVYEETDKMLFSWQEGGGGGENTSLAWGFLSPIAYFGKRYLGGRDEDDTRIFSLDARATGAPADTSQYYKAIDEIPADHVRIVASYLGLDMTTESDIEKNTDAIESEYAQNYLYPLAMETEDPDALHLVNRIQGEERQRADRRVAARADAGDLSQAEAALEMYTPEERERGAQMAVAGGRIPSPATILDELQLWELREGQKEFRELNPESDMSDRDLRYRLAIGYGHSEEAAQAHSGYNPRKSALEVERQGPRR